MKEFFKKFIERLRQFFRELAFYSGFMSAKEMEKFLKERDYEE